MAACAPGDRVICPVKDGKIVSVYELHYDSKEIFEIVCLYDDGYLVYIPHTLPLINMIYIDYINYKKYKLDTKYIGSNLCFITDYKISDIYSKIDGMSCAKCKDFFSMAASNMNDGTFLCWNCRAYPIYK